jgi:hypothetical protein
VAETIALCCKLLGCVQIGLFNISCGVRVHFPQPAETWALLVTANSPHQAAERKDQAKAEKDSRAQGRIERRVKKPLYYLGYLLPSQAPPACLLPACPPALRYCPLTISKHGHLFGALARLPVALTLCHTLNRSLAPTVPPSFGFFPQSTLSLQRGQSLFPPTPQALVHLCLLRLARPSPNSPNRHCYSFFRIGQSPPSTRDRRDACIATCHYPSNYISFLILMDLSLSTPIADIA